MISYEKLRELQSKIRVSYYGTGAYLDFTALLEAYIEQEQSELETTSQTADIYRAQGAVRILKQILNVITPKE